MRILGIETSCDDTAAAVVEDGRRILSAVCASQAEVHRPYGGVVPELASRRHIEAVVDVVNQALAEAGLAAADLDGVAVTQGPGLIGSLLVGFSFAKAFAWSLDLPLVGVNHLQAHVHTVFLSTAARSDATGWGEIFGAPARDPAGWAAPTLGPNACKKAAPTATTGRGEISGAPARDPAGRAPTSLAPRGTDEAARSDATGRGIMTQPPGYPFVALLASGGHTAVYHVTSARDMVLLGQTRDDAAGEAFDKVSKALGLAYPGGPVIDRLADAGDPNRVAFPRVWLDKDAFDFSFSGLKTAVARYIQAHPDEARDPVHIAAGFREAVVDVLVEKTVAAALSRGISRVAAVGGVAANSRLRSRLAERAGECGLAVFIPPVSLCGDNGAMIAAAGHEPLRAGERLAPDADVYSRTRPVA